MDLCFESIFETKLVVEFDALNLEMISTKRKIKEPFKMPYDINFS